MLFKGQLYVSVQCVYAQLPLTLCDPMDCSPPGSSVHGIPQARTLEWVAISFSRGSSQTTVELASPVLIGGCFTFATVRKVLENDLRLIPKATSSVSLPTFPLCCLHHTNPHQCSAPQYACGQHHLNMIMSITSYVPSTEYSNQDFKS